MRYLFSLILLVLLIISCQTNKNSPPPLGELHIDGQYCKYSDNNFLILPFELRKNGESIKLDTIRVYRDVQPVRLPFGKYEIIFKSIYQKQEIIEFELNNKVQKETLCIDKIGYKLSNSDLLSNQLKEDDKLTIDYNSSGCFHYTEYQLEIMRKGGLYVAKLPDTVFRLSPSQLQLIKEFEFELRNIRSNQCSTSDTYSLTTARNSETIEFTDASCHWNGYKGLLKKLGYKK